MSLLAILISLLLKKMLPTMHGLRSLAWTGDYQRWVQTRLANHEKWRGIPSVLIIVLLPVIGIAIIQYWLNDLLVFFSFVFSIVVLTYCLGPKDRHQLAHQYLEAEESEDADGAQSTLEEIFADTAPGALPQDKAARARLLTEEVLIQTHEQLLAILFWFVILGPMGAVLYRLAVQLKQQASGETKVETGVETGAETKDMEFHAAITRLHELLAWIPSHLTALSYAVMGSFTHAMRAWQNTPLDEANTDDTTPTSHRLLLRIGLASLQFDNHPPQDDAQHNESIRETLGLCGRSLVAWVTILALMTLAGWAS